MVHKMYENTGLTQSLDEFQTEEQRRVLDTVANVRRCGLDSFLPLPQIVVCGDQSSGKSSVLEALTEIPFPRSDNLCTRYATEIILRRAETSSLMVKIIPDSHRSSEEQARLESFAETITDFGELPFVMDLAKSCMGIDEVLNPDSAGGAFSRDVLSITMEGPSVPQLTLVDIPGLIANATLGVSDADVALVGEITDHYISQSRTICLAVISATNDHANQSIVTRIKKYDPQGDRTLGVITKPDRLEAGSASEQGFITLAQNKDINYKLGWHVLKNRSHAEANYSLAERNTSEANWLRNSRFNVLPVESLGIKSLRSRLSKLLFEHIKLELPKLRQEIEDKLLRYRAELNLLGESRASTTQCRSFLVQLSLKVREICKDGLDGNYNSDFFLQHQNEACSRKDVNIPISRIRAIIQVMNGNFAEIFRTFSFKYLFSINKDGFLVDEISSSQLPKDIELPMGIEAPKVMNRSQAMKWISDAITYSRGIEIYGSLNPVLVNHLFWEQSEKWEKLAEDHLENTADVCEEFLRLIITEICPKDIQSRLWENTIKGTLNDRRKSARKELKNLLADARSFPIIYDKTYIERISHQRELRQKALLKSQEEQEGEEGSVKSQDNYKKEAYIDILGNMSLEEDGITSTAKKFNCDEMFDSLLAIYKVS